MLNIQYSDMKKDLAGTIRSTAEFLRKTPTEKQINEAIEYLSLESMKKHINEQMNQFFAHLTSIFGVPSARKDLIREGKEGGYKSVMSKETIGKFDKKTQEMLSETGISF